MPRWIGVSVRTFINPPMLQADDDQLEAPIVPEIEGASKYYAVNQIRTIRWQKIIMELREKVRAMNVRRGRFY